MKNYDLHLEKSGEIAALIIPGSRLSADDVDELVHDLIQIRREMVPGPVYSAVEPSGAHTITCLGWHFAPDSSENGIAAFALLIPAASWVSTHFDIEGLRSLKAMVDNRVAQFEPEGK